MLQQLSVGLLATICLIGSCEREDPLSKVRLTEITRLTLADCSDQQFPIGEKKLIDQFWKAMVRSREIEVSLKLSKGYGRAWIHSRDNETPVYLELWALIDHDPVIVCGARRFICPDCGAFFEGLKKTYPDFNWCQQP